jgi:hypothetical protein
MKPALSLFFVTVFSVLCFSSCDKVDKPGPTVADGQIVDATTGKGIPNATVLLIRKTSGSVSAIDATQMETQVTDANGHFHFEFNAEGGFFYRIDANAMHYEEQSEGRSITSGQKNGNMKVSIKPLAYLLIKLINEPPLDKKGIYINGPFNPTIELIQFASDTAFYRAVPGNKENGVALKTRTTTGDSVLRYDVFCPALDTSEVVFKY